MIELLELNIKNFSTWESCKLPLQDQGLICIRGANGAGKSSIFRALEWCLYGKTSESFRVSELTTNNNPTWVRLIFRVNGNLYRLTRYRNHREYGNKVRLEGKYVPQTDEDSLMSDVQEHISRLLGIDDRIFLSSVYLAQRQFHYFHTLSDMGKKEFLESLTYGSLFGRCEEYAREKHRSIEKSIRQIGGEIDGLQYSLGHLREEQHIHNSTALVGIEKCHKEIVRCGALIDQEQQLIDTKRHRLDDLYSFSEEYWKRTHEVQLLHTTIAQINDMEACPTCYRYMSDQERESTLSNLSDQLAFKQRRIDFCKPYYITTERLEGEIRVHEKSMVDCHSKIRMLKMRVSYAKERDKDSKVEKQLEEKLTILQNQYKDLQCNLDYWKFWITGFSFRGLRSIILGNAVTNVQDITNHYLRKVGKDLDKLTMGFDDSKLSSMFGKRSYGSLSGGEKQITDLCTALAIRDTAEMYNKSKFNIIVLDEPMESIDKHFTARAQDLLQEVAKPSTFLITHQSLDADFDKIIEIYKKDGVSNMRILRG